MIDKDLIKENYSRMSDIQLINLAKNDGLQLPDETLELLEFELNKRNLSSEILDNIKNEKRLQRLREIESDNIKENEKKENSIWAFALDQKYLGKTNKELYDLLKSKGLDDNYSKLIIEKLEDVTTKLKNNSDSEMITGGLVFIIGVFVTFATLNNATNGGSYVIAWGAILFGAIRCYNGAKNKSRFSKILQNIENEK
jgi:hypothetical protein